MSIQCHNYYCSLFLFLQKNTFQGLLITDYNVSYAVFTYKCEDLNFPNGNKAVIGFVAPDGLHYNHPLSLSNQTASIDCLYYPKTPWVNVVKMIAKEGNRCTCIVQI